MSWRRKLNDAYYYWKCRLWHRYNMVVCKTLPPTWCDRDYLLLFACFQILIEFVELEQPWQFNATDEELDKAYVDCPGRGQEEIKEWAEIRELYRWGKSRLADKYVDNYKKDDEMLIRLIKVRGHLWT